MKQKMEECAAKICAGLKPTIEDNEEERYYSSEKWKVYDAYLEGSKRKEEQLQHLVDSHSELLEALNSMKIMYHSWLKQDENTIGYRAATKALAAIEKAQSLINK